MFIKELKLKDLREEATVTRAAHILIDAFVNEDDETITNSTGNFSILLEDDNQLLKEGNDTVDITTSTDHGGRILTELSTIRGERVRKIPVERQARIVIEAQTSPEPNDEGGRGPEKDLGFFAPRRCGTPGDFQPSDLNVDENFSILLEDGTMREIVTSPPGLSRFFRGFLLKEGNEIVAVVLAGMVTR